MKTVSCFPCRPIIAALALLAPCLAGPGDGRAQPAAGLTCQKPLPPEGHATSNPLACTVSCANGGTVASALALAPRTTAVKVDPPQDVYGSFMVVNPNPSRILMRNGAFDALS